MITLTRASGDEFRLVQGLLGFAAAINGEGGVPSREVTAESYPYVVEALRINRTLPPGHPTLLNEAVILNHLAWHEAHQPGGYPAAVRHFSSAIAIHKRIGYRLGHAIALVELGHLHRHAGANDAAIDSFQRGLELAGDVQDLQAEALAGLVHCYQDRGDRAMAERLRHAALSVLAGRHHPGTNRIRAALEDRQAASG